MTSQRAVLVPDGFSGSSLSVLSRCSSIATLPCLILLHEDGRIFIRTCCNSRVNRLLLSRGYLKRPGPFRLPILKSAPVACLFALSLILPLPTLHHPSP